MGRKFRGNQKKENGKGGISSFMFLIDLHSAEIKPGFIEQKTLDAEEYLASLGMTMRVDCGIKIMPLS